ncbi:DegT/DnrJ/EryC1/StrS family aminotransferase [Gammaproteobacteria bacterium]|nr:DegT/DnrJ/EryC1/StrS family aminotransferase [Gammaproteobacteria bacterium]
MINVTKPYLPPLDEILPALEAIWKTKGLTNSGVFEKKLESALENYLGVENLSLVSSGTVGLMLALKASNVKGEVITTPYSFAATSNVLSWCGLEPVFVDIDPHNLNIDPMRVEAAITPNTGAILAVHCYGNPCDIEALNIISKKYDIPIIYDACHAFGVVHDGRSVLEGGDHSVVSFHATKVFNTFEGGAIVSKTLADKEAIQKLKNFGFQDEVSITHRGLNGKMSEFNAAVGLAQLSHMNKIFEKRGQVDSRYRIALGGIKYIQCLPQYANGVKNFSYFPILVSSEVKLMRDQIVSKMRDKGINVRRYFYPLISEFDAYKAYSERTREECPIAYSASLAVICLPIYPDLISKEQEFIIETLVQSLLEIESASFI